MAVTRTRIKQPDKIPPKIIEGLISDFTKYLISIGVNDHEIIESRILVTFDVSYYTNRITISSKDIFGECHHYTIIVDEKDFPL